MPAPWEEAGAGSASGSPSWSLSGSPSWKGKAVRPDPMGLLAGMEQPAGQGAALVLSETCQDTIRQQLVMALQEAAATAQDGLRIDGPAEPPPMPAEEDFARLVRIVYLVLQERVQAVARLLHAEEHRTARHRDAVNQYSVRFVEQEQQIEQQRMQLHVLQEQLAAYQRGPTAGAGQADADSRVRTMFDQLTADFRIATAQMNERLNKVLAENRGLKDANMRLEQRLEAVSVEEAARQKTMFVDRVALLHLEKDVRRLRDAYTRVRRSAATMRFVAASAFSALQQLYREASPDPQAQSLFPNVPSQTSGPTGPQSPVVSPVTKRSVGSASRRSVKLDRTDPADVLSPAAPATSPSWPPPARDPPPPWDALPAYPLDDPAGPPVSRAALAARERLRKRGTAELAADLFDFNRSLYDTTHRDPPRVRLPYKFELQNPKSPALMNPDQPAYILDRMTMELKKYVQQMNVQFAALPYRPAAGPPPKAAPRSPPRPRLATPPDPPDGDGPADNEGPRAPLGNRPTEIRPPLPPQLLPAGGLAGPKPHFRSFVGRFCASTQRLLTHFEDVGPWWQRSGPLSPDQSDEAMMRVLLALYHFLRHAMGLTQPLDGAAADADTGAVGIPSPTPVPAFSPAPGGQPTPAGRLNPLRSASPQLGAKATTPPTGLDPLDRRPPSAEAAPGGVRWDAGAVAREGPPMAAAARPRPAAALPDGGGSGPPPAGEGPVAARQQRRPFNQSLFQGGKLTPSLKIPNAALLPNEQ